MMGRVRALDGLRGIAILMVIARHVSIEPMSRDVPTVMLEFVRSSGWLGVDLFFVLSGFLITGVLLDTREHPGYWRNFYARRALRIWPLYALLVAFVFIVGTRVGSFDTEGLPNPLVWMAFAQNLYMGLAAPPPTTFDFAWSLGVEEHVYLMLPALVLLCSRRTLALLLAAVLVVEPAARSLLMAHGVSNGALYFMTPIRLDGFAVGGLLAIVARRPQGLGSLARWAPAVFGVAAIAIIGIGASLLAFEAQPPMDTWGFTVAALLFGSALVLALESPRVGGALSWEPLRRFGLYSYAIYLVHIPIWVLLGPSVKTLVGHGWLAQLGAWAIMLPLYLLAGWLSWTLIESRFLALKRYFAPRQSTSLEHADDHHLGVRISDGADGRREAGRVAVDLYLDRVAARRQGA